MKLKGNQGISMGVLDTGPQFTHCFLLHDPFVKEGELIEYKPPIELASDGGMYRMKELLSMLPEAREYDSKKD